MAAANTNPSCVEAFDSFTFLTRGHMPHMLIFLKSGFILP